LSDTTQNQVVDFSDALGERYLSYALSTITSRSLPDVRDGLKPVHRRLLWAMLQLKMDPKSSFKKCARVVGDVIGKYHPHGDTAVYDTMVRLAQDFAVRYPLVDGQGNFGSVDGDNAAAMRYTEARMTEVAIWLLKDIDKDTVNFRETYDNHDIEPVVLPSCFPNLLANGSEGIAVGMATSIPPHNVSELCDALSYLIKSPNATIEKLVQFVHGPDFPTGGLLVEPRSSIINTYSTGKGAFRLRAKWEKEDLGHGMYQIVVTEIPYQVNKSKLLEKTAQLYKDKRLAMLGNLRDESAEEIRVVFEPKTRTVDPEMLMESLFKLTDLEIRFNLNMNVLSPEGMPRVMNLREVLQCFLDHRHEVLIRRSQFRLNKIDHRLEVLQGLMIAYLNLDEVIRIIRFEDEPKKVMIDRWDLTEVQVEAILNMRLRSLHKLEEIAITKEINELEAEKAGLLELLSNEVLRWKAISEEVKDIKKHFGNKTELGKRRTEIGDAPKDVVISIEAFVEKEPITVICSKLGWIRSFKGHNIDEAALKYKEGDEGRFIIKTNSTDKLLAFGTNGRFYTLGCDKLPGAKGNGEAIRLMIDIEQDKDIFDIFVYEKGTKLLVASKAGKGFVVESDDVIANTKNGKQVLNIPEKANNIEDNYAAICAKVEGTQVAVLGDNRKLLIFELEEMPTMRRGQGVQLQRYRDGGLADLKVFAPKEGLTWSLGERTRTETNLFEWTGKRGHSGRMPPNGFPKKNRFS
jgi:topoisomerase-4 subunit A